MSIAIKIEMDAHELIRRELARRIKYSLPRATWKEVASDLIKLGAVELEKQMEASQ